MQYQKNIFFVVAEKKIIVYVLAMDCKTLIAAFGGKKFFVEQLGFNHQTVLQWQYYGLPKTYSRRLALIQAIEHYDKIDPRLKDAALDFVRDPNN